MSSAEEPAPVRPPAPLTVRRALDMLNEAATVMEAARRVAGVLGTTIVTVLSLSVLVLFVYVMKMSNKHR